MSLASSFPRHVPVTALSSPANHGNKIVMLRKKQVSNKKTPIIQIKFFSKNKVFEDQSEGVICYRDENGEMVCEDMMKALDFVNEHSIILGNHVDINPEIEYPNY
ncbi:Remorin family protein [Hibiscus syriacus]|uniref:Remorin family protein n=1 Tax=Hibiscus syriacus TaxID=106335 RepID=A0A6A3AW21_HIBSY|nr:Remorin family protein [Hibiscus syriacus]